MNLHQPVAIAAAGGTHHRATAHHPHHAAAHHAAAHHAVAHHAVIFHPTWLHLAHLARVTIMHHAWFSFHARGCAIAAGSRCYSRSEEHTSELQSLMRISYAIFCLKKKNTHP